VTPRKPRIPVEPRGLRRESAAAYVGVAPATFDTWVKHGVMPRPKRQDGVVVWDRLELDSAFDDLPCESVSQQEGWDMTRLKGAP
jgi:predicted DNA-binding transcriptional regulator AlpA